MKNQALMKWICYLCHVSLAAFALEAGAGSIVYSYDSLDRLTAVSFGDNLGVQYNYDRAGNRVRVEFFEAAPVILSQPVLPAIPVQGMIELSVRAAGSRPITYQWQKDGEDLPGATRPGLRLTASSTEDAGTYRVRVTNPLDTVVSDEVTVGPASALVSFAGWIEAMQVPPELRAPDADAANDGLQNLLAYFFNIDPVNGRDPADFHALPRAAFEETAETHYLILIYRENRAATGLSLHILGSETLAPGAWLPIEPTAIEEFGVDPATGDPLYAVKIDVTNTPTKFLRLGVSIQE
jgi:hypothetical protein